MFDKIREKWRKKRELKARWNVALEAIDADGADGVKHALEALRNDTLDDEDRAALLKKAINRQDVPVFREVLAFVGDPNVLIKWSETSGDRTINHSYTPLGYAIGWKRTHDISLALANNAETRVNDELMESAKKEGMQDVAAVLAKRLADLRRREAAVLDKEAVKPGDVEEAAVPAPAEAAKPAPEAWTLVTPTSVAHVTTSEALGRKLTEIFNFDNRERVLITENLKTGAESIAPAESFDNLGPETLQRAEQALRRLKAEPGARTSFSL
jgi:hypothetical protein